VIAKVKTRLAVGKNKEKRKEKKYRNLKWKDLISGG